jgi:TPP-dependent pyruvate/acetoin dehydrogenase alpha subunit
MRAEDSFAASRDGFIVNFIQGEPLKNIFKRLLAAANASELAAQLKKAMDSARASKREKNGRIALAYFGERSAAFGAWQKALTLAGKERLPIVFVCHASVRDDRFGVDEATKAALGFPCIPVDGSDVVAVYRVATEAIAHARKGNGATLIVCKAERAMAHDPIAKMEAYLTRKGIFSEAMKVEAASGFAKELNAALRAARMRRSPASSEVVGRRRNS